MSLNKLEKEAAWKLAKKNEFVKKLTNSQLLSIENEISDLRSENCQLKKENAWSKAKIESVISDQKKEVEEKHCEMSEACWVNSNFFEENVNLKESAEKSTSLSLKRKQRIKKHKKGKGLLLPDQAYYRVSKFCSKQH